MFSVENLVATSSLPALLPPYSLPLSHAEMAAPIPLVPPVMSATLMVSSIYVMFVKFTCFNLNISIVKINNFYAKLLIDKQEALLFNYSEHLFQCY